jgi:flagellar biosynthesis/type III secretory pathway chaperone
VSIDELIQAIDSLSSLHEELLHVSKEKTAVIKEGEVEKLQPILVKERKLIRRLEKAEKERMERADIWAKENNLKEDVTITRMLEEITDNESRDKLEQATIQLTETMTDLKAQEKLNVALIHQSMQFVQLSLDLLSPTLKNMNYSNTNKQNVEPPNRSIFDSKA